jgi:uncharacterized radical SAM protein YgiQ
MFIPATIKECNELNWKELDVILVTGDAYIDSSYCGIAIIGKILINAGYKVALVSQPRLNVADDIMFFGNPKLFWGITAGAMDSMVANWTALKKKRRSDTLTPGGINNRRPDRATLKYVNLIKQFADKQIPIVLGGIEASLRRLAHYDYWENKIRRSLLLDAKADYLVYGEGEKTIIEIAEVLKYKEADKIRSMRGVCYLANHIDEIDKNEYILLPTYEEVIADDEQFISMFDTFYKNNDPLNSKGLIQKFDNRYVVQNPPNYYLKNEELDKIYELDYENAIHPKHKLEGEVKGIETIRYSITTHRGCFGECNFCAISAHQGRTIRSRSQASIIREVKKITNDKHFKGNINDLGGATANMYMMDCAKQIKEGSCKNKRCLFPKLCSVRQIDHSQHLQLIQAVSNIPKVKKIFIKSGLRYDLIQYDKKNGGKYFDYIISNCVSGQMKIAPEHIDNNVLKAMAKPEFDLNKFINDYYFKSKKINKKQFLTYYLIAGHPCCSETEMYKMRTYFKNEIKILPEQIQIFTPTPSTYSTLMFFTEKDFQTKQKIFVEKSPAKLQKQKDIISSKYEKNI